MNCQFCGQGAIAKNSNGPVCPDCWAEGYGSEPTTTPKRPADDEIDRLRAENERLRDNLAWAYDTLEEINISNYDHDDVCRLNAASVEVILGIAVALQNKGDE